MDDFRDVSYSEPYIYVLDPTTGKTKTVIDRFYSFIWTERYAEAGEFELSGPESELWTSLIQEGDYLQFSHSDILKGYNVNTLSRDGGETGRITMVVEQRYTEWDSEKEYTVFAKGRSLESIFDRRINLGVGKESVEYTLEGVLIGSNALTSDPEITAGGYGLGIRILDGNQWPPDRYDEYYKDGFATSCDRWDESAAHKINNLIPETFMTELYGRTYEYVLLQAILYNCGKQAIKNRQFENFEVTEMIPMRLEEDDPTTGLKAGQIKYFFADKDGANFDKRGHRVQEVYDGKMDNLYDIVTEFLEKCEDANGGVGYRIVGSTQQLSPLETDTAFKITFSLYMGEDLSIDGPYRDRGDKVVIFSRDWDNLESMNYIHGQEHYKNVCYQDTGLDCEPEDLWSIRMELMDLDVKSKELDNRETDNQKKEDNGQTVSEQEKKEIEDERKRIQNEQDRLERFQAEAQKKYDRLGHRSFYYGVYPRLSNYNTDTYKDPPYATGLARRECYNSDAPPLSASDDFEYQGRARYKFTKWEQYDEKVRKKDADPNDQSDAAFNIYRYWRAIDVGCDWWDFSQRISLAAFTFLHQEENSEEDDVEASVNYNAVYQPVRDYRVGDIVSVMGIHNNETVRKMRCDEMVYTVDPEGFTIVPTFSILPLKDDAQ